jgi:internalin A
MAELTPEEAFAEAERLIAEAKANGETGLNLSGLGLKEVPESLAQLTQLRYLNLDRNHLATVPESMCQLVKLQNIFLTSNQLTTIPATLVRLTELKELFLQSNHLTTIPKSLAELTQLKVLSLSNNHLTEIPESFGGLRELNSFYMHDNELTTLPASFTQLNQLQHLNLADNRLTTVPDSIRELTQLEALYLSRNQLTTLPESFGQLTRLRNLDLTGNRLALLPQSLRSLKSLRQLFLHGNPRLRLPRSVLGPTRYEAKGDFSDVASPPAILDYYFRTRLAQERRPLREAKLILVGRGEVGKTSLVRRLVENKFSRREDRTQGIRITQWPLALKRGEEVRMHVWDFGGQEIMHATHQFFLTDRSVYVLVLDGRAGQQEVEADYWLRIISSFAPESPVLVVLNKIKRDPFDLNRRALQEKFQQVRDFIETDCDNPNSKKQSGAKGLGIDELRKAIVRVTNVLPDLRAPFPAAWFEIKEKLSKTKKDYMPFDKYRALCVEFGEQDEGAQESLATHLHRLGVALNYRADRRLRDTHVLNPHWVTEGIYALLNSARLAQKKGELRLEDLKKELDPKRYPTEMHQFLLHLMEKFELCFSFENSDRYLIPELLDEQQPKEADKFDPATCLNFRYRYPVIPTGLLPRFIVRTHVLSDRYRWRTGVILEFEGNRALVKADLQDRRIFISIDGPTADGRRRMLAMIREDFDSIHRDIQHLKPEEMVPLPTHPHIIVPHHDLEVLERNDHAAIWRQVIGNDVVEVAVRDLLNGVDIAPRPASDIRTAEPLSVFYSYAHADAKQRLKLDKHLAPLRRLGLIADWCDNDILPGDAWAEEISRKLKSADIVLLLVSADFVSSKYCYEVELDEAMKRHEEGAAVVLPIIVRQTNAWTKLPFGKLKALPTDGKAIPKWPSHDEGWADVASGVERAAEGLKNRGVTRRD